MTKAMVIAKDCIAYSDALQPFAILGVLVPSGLSNPPGKPSSTVAIEPLINIAADTQNDAASHLAGVKYEIIPPTTRQIPTCQTIGLFIHITPLPRAHEVRPAHAVGGVRGLVRGII